MSKTSVRVKFRASTIVGRPGTIYYQVIHNRVVRQIGTQYRIRPAQWDARRQRPVNALTGLAAAIEGDLDRLEEIVDRLCASGTYTADAVVRAFGPRTAGLTLGDYVANRAEALTAQGRTRTARAYRSALGSFRRFNGGADVALTEITAPLMAEYERYLRTRRLAPNTVSFYMRQLRAVYNSAVARGLTADARPFVHVFTGRERTAKRAMTLEELRRVHEVDLSGKPTLAFARDMFMLSYYLRGMSYIDMARLRTTDLRDGHIIYNRSKTGRELSIPWTAEMAAIAARYPGAAEGRLLPIVRGEAGDFAAAARRAYRRLNAGIQRVGRILGLAKTTLYCARHTWASVAHAQGYPLSLISQGMGHRRESTTLIYLRTLTSPPLDSLTRSMIALVSNSFRPHGGANKSSSSRSALAPPKNV